MKRKANARVIPVFGFGFLFSVLLIGATLCVLGFFVKNGDLRGGVLTVFLIAAMLPACVLYPVLVQRKLRLQGLLCGAVCGALISVSYFLFTATVLNFHFLPFLWLILPVGIAAAVCSGIFSANFFRR